MLFCAASVEVCPVSYTTIERRIKESGNVPAFCKRPVRCVVVVVVLSWWWRLTATVDSICGSVTDSGLAYR